MKWLASLLVDGLFKGLVDWWRSWRQRADAVQIGRDEITIDALEKATDHEHRMAEENLRPPVRGDVADRLRDGTF